MYEIDKEKFGTFLSRLRRERGITQKGLAEKLYVSDKAVSKWERGASLPDISLLQPLADMFDVTITELLSGQRLAPDQPLTVQEVEPLVGGTLRLRVEEERELRAHRRLWGKRMALAVLAFLVEMLVVSRFIPLFDDRAAMLWVAPILALCFGIYFALFSREKLPAFYDEYKIDFVSDGAFRMNVPGVRFNNNNWPHILDAMRAWACVTLAGWAPVFAVLYLTLEWLGTPDSVTHMVTLMTGLGAVLGGMFVPVYVVGRKYE